MPTTEDEKTFEREIEYTTRFKRDYKRERRGRYRASIAEDLLSVVERLADDVALPERMVDHALAGVWKDHRDCHVRPDLVLIYRKLENPPRLQLVRLGSHSELGL